MGTARERRSRLNPWGIAPLLAAGFLLGVINVSWTALPADTGNRHFVYLAQSFVDGRLDIDQAPRALTDVVTWEGHRYLPLGPLPAVLAVPFLPLLAAGLSLHWIGLAVTVASAWLLWRVLALVGVGGERRTWIMLLFFGGTVYFGALLVSASSYYLSHLVAVTCLLAAIAAQLSGRHPALVGLLLGLAGATRLAVLFTLPFFLWLSWRAPRARLDQQEPGDGRALVRRSLAAFSQLGLGLALPLALLAAYNAARFGSPLESGYALSTLDGGVLEEARRVGTFNLAHVPKNLFFLLLQGPEPFPSAEAPVLLPPYAWPSHWGMGLFHGSPALLYAFRAPRQSRLVQACWLGIASALVPIITYYGIGTVQTGYRYALDFLPLLLILAALGLSSPLSRTARWLVLASVAVSAWAAVFLVIWITGVAGWIPV